MNAEELKRLGCKILGEISECWRWRYVYFLSLFKWDQLERSFQQMGPAEEIYECIFYIYMVLVVSRGIV
jgi:hypothetical protein